MLLLPPLMLGSLGTRVPQWVRLQSAQRVKTIGILLEHPKDLTSVAQKRCKSHMNGWCTDGVLNGIRGGQRSLVTLVPFGAEVHRVVKRCTA